MQLLLCIGEKEGHIFFWAVNYGLFYMCAVPEIMLYILSEGAVHLLFIGTAMQCP